MLAEIQEKRKGIIAHIRMSGMTRRLDGQMEEYHGYDDGGRDIFRLQKGNRI